MGVHIFVHNYHLYMSVVKSLLLKLDMHWLQTNHGGLLLIARVFLSLWLSVLSLLSEVVNSSSWHISTPKLAWTWDVGLCKVWVLLNTSQALLKDGFTMADRFISHGGYWLFPWAFTANRNLRVIPPEDLSANWINLIVSKEQFCVFLLAATIHTAYRGSVRCV